MMRMLKSLAVSMLVLCPVSQAQLVTTTTMHLFADESAVADSSSTLVRNNAGVTTTILTSGLGPGDTYTIWWVIFNNPEECSAPCGEDDLLPRGGNPAIQNSVLYAAGHIVSDSGKGDFAAHLKVGDATGALFGPGLLDPMGAEIHLVTRNHGSPIPGMVEEQIGSFNGGCPPNDCEDDQFAIHLPGADQVSMDLEAIRMMLTTLDGKADATKSLLNRLAAAHSLNPVP